MNLKVNRNLIIPENEIKWRFSRSSGPGGQNVNKLESRVEIIFNIQKSKALNPIQKDLLLKKLKNKINNGFLCLKVQKKRTQYENRKLATDKLISLLKGQLISAKKVRKLTKPTKSSKKRRVESKKKRGELKRRRQNNLQANY
tara:strand:+ start:2559 stop:2987 length:429 start_codon:yes stop_codon:yes gene_type:complete